MSTLNGEEFEQPAELVLLCAFSQHNVHLLLLSGIGKPYDPATSEGVVGRNYAYQITLGGRPASSRTTASIRSWAAGALGQAIDDFNGDNFDHGPHGLHRRRLHRAVDHRRPADPAATAVPQRHAEWGSAWKKASRELPAQSLAIATHGSVMSYRDTYLDLDPTYRDLLRQPAAAHDLRLPRQRTARCRNFLTDKATRSPRR